MQIATSKTRDQFPLSSKKIIKKTIVDVTSYAIILLIILAGVLIPILSSINQGSQETYYWSGSVAAGFLGLISLVILLTYLYQRWYFAVYFYDLTPDFIQIKKGPITPKEITIPYERIQDVYVDQDLLDRMLGIYDVHLSSATASSGMEAHIDGLGKQAADGLRAVLLKTMTDKIRKNKA